MYITSTIVTILYILLFLNSINTLFKSYFVINLFLLSQVLINIFNNAKDVLVEKNIEDKWIKINIEVKENLAVISIEDNGGGIPEEILLSQEIIRKNLN